MGKCPFVQSMDFAELAKNIKAWGQSLGFQQVGISDLDLAQHEPHLKAWLKEGMHGSMSFFERNMRKRLQPEMLVPGTLRIISVRMNYLPEDAKFASSLNHSKKAYISRYALGRDYHKVMRKRLKALALKIQTHIDELSTNTHFEYRPFVDSAPVLEHAIAEKAGLGWTGKHSLTLNKDAGSWFFLGELFINLPLPTDSPVEEGCGSCTACISICPTQAIVAPYKVDARRCISYLTIEHEGAIDEEYRKPMGNRIYGCDDCQLVCPYNRASQLSEEEDFKPRHGLIDASLLELFHWNEAQFLKMTEGSAIRRIGIKRWRRNISVAMGNAQFDETLLEALQHALQNESDPVLLEHYAWAIEQQQSKALSRKDARHQIDVKDISRQQARLVRVIKKGLPRDA